MRRLRFVLRKGTVRAAAFLLLILALCAVGCARQDAHHEDGLRVVATTTMLADLSRAVGGARVSVEGLMGPGIDPHLYQASAGDVLIMQTADAVVYNGLHLEGKMGDVFAGLSGQGKHVLCAADGLSATMLIAHPDDARTHDPHIWFDATLWKHAAQTVAAGFSQADPAHAAEYAANCASYTAQLDELDRYIRDRAAEFPEKQRILITAHDAFQYFGRAYGFTVLGLQGISTDTQAGTADVRRLAEYIVAHKVKAVFVESSVPPKTIEALQAAVRARGFDVAIGGTLYSDSLGDAASDTDTYLKTARANIDAIVDALK